MPTMGISSVPRTKYTRYFYKGNERFEQSLDVWEPVDVLKDGKESHPLVVLVVGSGWMGHRSVIYAGTSWWNASGPRTFARLGCVCVCVRHRGAFPSLPVDGRLVLSFAFVVATAVYHQNAGPILVVLAGAVLLGLWGLWTLAVRGCAKFDDMLQDVGDALVWVHGNKETILGHKKEVPLVFGGYSSGGHVAATLLQRPHVLKSRGLPEPEKVCDAVLFVSGVLAVRPPVDSQRSAQWLTNLALKTAFGDEAHQVPSPLHEGQLPRLPHLLIGCADEVFGTGWLDVFFSSRAFCEVAKARGVPVRYIEVKSDHWFILGSQVLSTALVSELQWLSVGHATHNWACLACHRQRCIGIGCEVSSARPLRAE